jgi:hypothetical protein
MKDIGNWAAYVNRGLDSLISIVKKRMGYLRQVLFVDLAFVHAGLRDFTQAWGIDRFWAVSQLEVWGKRTYGNAVFREQAIESFADYWRQADMSVPTSSTF